MKNIILTSSFSTVGSELKEKGFLPSAPQRVALIPTAAQCYATHPWLDDDRRALAKLGYDVYDVDFVGKTTEELRDALTPATIIFVAGGNTTFLAQQAHHSGFDGIITDLLAEGRMYIGSSAGSILAGPSIEPFIEEDLPELPKDFQLHNPAGLGLVDYVILPHYPQFAEYDKKVENGCLVERAGRKFDKT